MPAREDTINTALGEVLQALRPTSWRVLAEEQRTLRGSAKRPDVLIEEPAGWPVVIEAERENHTSAERDALERLGEIVEASNREIESAIALVYPPDVREQTGGKALRAALRETEGLEYALYTATSGDAVDRLPESGWLRGNVRDLAMLAHRASTPETRVQRLVDTLEHGVSSAYGVLERRHGSRAGQGIGPQIAEILGQSDDPAGQTRLMAMTVLINALIFHDSLAEAAFIIDNDRPVALVRQFNSTLSGFDQQAIIEEWRAILQVNYWPIFATAGAILERLPTATANAVLQPLWEAAQDLIRGGVTRSHDLTGVIFQRLIADRKFLATYYTRPSAAALLAALALPVDRPLGGADWGDADTIAALQIGDFACGTGTLLAAAYSRLSALHELHGGDPKALHPPMMKHGLHGLDVLNIAVHLTAAMLAGSHPDVPFDGECLLTMPYGEQSDGSVAVGSLDLLAEQVQPGLIGQAAAITAGGREPEEVANLVDRVGHDKFDLVIMNPPFTRPTNHEGEHADVPIPAYAAFDNPPEIQERLSERVKSLARGAASDGNAGLPSYFVELAHRKLRPGGTLALVLPLSVLSGKSWDATRRELRSSYADLIVITISEASSYSSSFSADTGMAECLIIARQNGRAEVEPRATFVILDRQPMTVSHSALLADQIAYAIRSNTIRRLNGGAPAMTPLTIGEEGVGHIWDCPLPDEGPWPVAGIVDASLAFTAYHLEQGRFISVTSLDEQPVPLPIAKIAQIARRGPVHRDITGVERDGTIRGPFERVSPPVNPIPTHPLLWHHNAQRERALIVEPDSEGLIREVADRQEEINRKASRIEATASRAHYNLDLRFNSQSLIVAMTERKCIGGVAWPSVIFNELDHEYAFVLWSNSTLGLLLRWWVSNKTQSGRGRVTVTGVPGIPSLDTRALTEEQHAAAREAFEAMRDLRFLPFDQIDEDPARAELDRRLLVDVLGLPASLCEPDGPIDLLRRKLAREPQIHGGKKSRVVFTDDGEKTERRHDRD